MKLDLKELLNKLTENAIPLYIADTSSDNTGYTVNANATRVIAYSLPTKSGYTLKHVTARTNQNYIATGVGVTGNNIYVTLRNGLGSNIDAVITLQYIWERN